ncbi:MAG: helix-hairpin-helix domain-containing protein [Deltaproteobacteria bacterium]|nr:helix-hairpin-helix domain-containing protein [Deltaproteobacteria bacterium]
MVVAVWVSVVPAAQPVKAKAGKAALTGKLNINTATAKEIALLPGIGKKTAKTIVEYRSSNGGFKALDDLLKIKGVGKKTIAKCKNYLVLNGETTLAKVKR